MTVTMRDTFTDATGVNLNAHTPDLGATGWTKWGTSDLLITPDGEVRSSGADAKYAAVYTPPGGSYIYAGDLVCKSQVAVQSQVLIVRLPTTVGTSAEDSYRASFLATDTAGNGSWRIVRASTNGSATILATDVDTFTTGQTKRVTFVLATPGQVILFVGGVARCVVFDTTITRTGRVGLAGFSSQGSKDVGIQTSLVELDDLVGIPVNTTLPAITGLAETGQTLSISDGAWTNTPTAFSYQWMRNGGRIAAATASTYTLVGADEGQSITCVVKASNASGYGAAAATARTVAPPSTTAPSNTVAPIITTDGTPQAGETVTCSTGTWAGTEPITYAYQWQRGGVNIAGATSSSYLLAAADIGVAVVCRVTATNSAGSATASSNTITPAAADPLDASHIKLRFSGGAGNASGATSLGGARGSLLGGGVGALFDAIPGTSAQAGTTLYRVIYVENTHPTATWQSIAAFIETQFAATGLQLAVGVPAEAANSDVPTLASGTTAPGGVNFSTATTPATGAFFGDLPANGYRGLYLRLTVSPATPATASATAYFAVEGTPG